MLDREFQEWFRPRPGRCSTCAHHAVEIDENEDLDCYCGVEDGGLAGSTPGMHLDHCAFPALPGERGCAIWIKLEPPEGEG